MVEVRSGHVAPGEAGCGTRFETRSVAYKVGDDHFKNLRGELTHHIRAWSTGREQIANYGFCPGPDDADNKVDPYDASTTERGPTTKKGKLPRT